MDEINSKEGKGSKGRKEFGVEKEWQRSEQLEGERETDADGDGEIIKSQIMQQCGVWILFMYELSWRV